MTNEVIAFIALGVAFTIILYYQEKKYNSLLIDRDKYKKYHIENLCKSAIRNNIIPELQYILDNLDSIIQDNDFDHDMYSGDYGNSEMRDFHSSDELQIEDLIKEFDLVISTGKIYLTETQVKNLIDCQERFEYIKFNKYDKQTIKSMLNNIIDKLNLYF